ncbi:winged helix-turn-helix transcriptional regulator [Streptomyces sp. NPDC001102]
MVWSGQLFRFRLWSDLRKQIKGSSGEADLRRADSLAREIFSDVANKWAFLIIETLGECTLRFSELRNEIEGINHKMLTQNLRMLERNGPVERHVHPTVPPRVEYTLRHRGRPPPLRRLIPGEARQGRLTTRWPGVHAERGEAVPAVRGMTAGTAPTTA